MTTIESSRLGKLAQSSKLVVVALFGLLGLAGLGVWWFQLGEAAVMAVSLVIAVVALATVGLRTTIRNPANQPSTQPLQPVSVEENRPANWSAADNASADTNNSARSTNSKRWSLDVFAAIDAQRFAAVCETWFSWAGFDTRSQSHPTKEGVDIWLHAAKMPGPVAIVRCKHGLDKPVGLPEMKEFLGVVAAFKSAHGTFTTTSTYTPEALQFAKDNGIEAVDGRGLLRRILTRTRQSQQALLAVAYSGHS